MKTLKTDIKWEFGDFQTPRSLANQVIKKLLVIIPHLKPQTIIEPSCGRGSFLFAAADSFPAAKNFIGFEINNNHLDIAVSEAKSRKDSSKFNLVLGDFFRIDWKKIITQLPKPILIVGNPPWVTNSDIGKLKGSNLPAKSNFEKKSGLDSMTGKSNFDISEHMIGENLKWIENDYGFIAVLCKDSVARKVLKRVWRDKKQFLESRLIRIDTLKYFNASVDASLFIALSTKITKIKSCKVYDSISSKFPLSEFGYYNKCLISNIPKFQKYQDFFGFCNEYTWRSGLKHDCSKVMELKKEGGKFKNKFDKTFKIEDTYIYPLLKSSDVANGRVLENRLHVIVTQSQIGQATHEIRHKAPLTWKYLFQYSDKFRQRKSSIYSNKPPFSIFGIGLYSFKNWKVAISGLYKNLNFQIIGPINGKPVIFDDTVYSIGVDSQKEAELLATILNSKECKDFLDSMIFWNSKRPITVDLLKRINLKKVAEKLGKSSLYKSFIPLGRQILMFS